MNTVTKWMSWANGVDLGAQFQGKEDSIIIIHVAAMVHTPVGSAPSGMILVQESSDQAPSIMAFISENLKVANYFGPNVFADTPFENAPALEARISVTHNEHSCAADITIGETSIQVTMDHLAHTTRASRQPNEENPFTQHVLERPTNSATLCINGETQNIVIPPSPENNPPSSAFTPTGIYSR